MKLYLIDSKSRSCIFCILYLLFNLSLIASESQCNSHPILKKIIENKQRWQSESDNFETALNLSTAYQDLGLFEQAIGYANQGLNLSPNSGDLLVAKVHALYLSNKTEEALKLALTTFYSTDEISYSRGMKSWLRHSILSMYLEKSHLKEAEALIIKEYPNARELIDKAVSPQSLILGIPLHTLEPLIYIYRKTSRVADANAFSRHLEGFSAESFFETTVDKLLPTQHWLLASVWAGVPESTTKIVNALEKAYEGGFIKGWQFNYAHHPVYWMIQDSKEFKELINQIQQDMKKLRACYKASLN